MAAQTCAVCGELVTSAESGQREVRCGLCQRARLPFAKAVAYGSYDGALRGLIHLLKYDRVRPAADALGGLLAEAMAGLKFAAAEKAVLVVPVPLASGRERQRGFNQAEEMARAALRHWSRRGAVAGEKKTAQARAPVPHDSSELGSAVVGETPAVRGNIAQARAPVPHSPSELELGTSALRRTRETQSQTGLTRHQRRANLRGAFVAARPNEIAGREIILVDDVYTTGTTVYECARVLRRAGAAEVQVATAARVLKGETPEAAAEESAAAIRVRTEA
jgi:predicted amidophosphoribosyltransferase